MTDKEMIEWAGISYDGEEIPPQLLNLIKMAQFRGARLAWRDMYQISSTQVANYSLPAASSSESASPTSGAQAAQGAEQ